MSGSMRAGGLTGTQRQIQRAVDQLRRRVAQMESSLASNASKGDLDALRRELDGLEAASDDGEVIVTLNFDGGGA